MFHRDSFHNRHPKLAYSLRGLSPAMPTRYLAGDSEECHFGSNRPGTLPPTPSLAGAIQVDILIMACLGTYLDTLPVQHDTWTKKNPLAQRL